MQRLIRINLITTLTLAMFLAASPSRSVRAVAPDYEPGQIVVKLAPLLVNNILGINQSYGTLTLASLPGHSDIFLLQAPLGVVTELLVQVMAHDVRLVYAELNYINENTEDGGTNRTYGWGDDSTPKQNQD